MPEYLAPGVFVEEVSFRAKSIEGVSTSTCGLVGPTRRGPTSGTPEVITNFGDFERVYGGYANLSFKAGSTTINYMAHAVRALFENGGRRLYVARTYLPRMDQAGNPVSGKASYQNPGKFSLKSRYPGSGYNGVVQLFQKTTRMAGKTPLDRASDGTFIRVSANPVTDPDKVELPMPAGVDGSAPPFNLNHNDQLELSVKGTAKSITILAEPADTESNEIVNPAVINFAADSDLLVTVNNDPETRITFIAGNYTAAEVESKINAEIDGAKVTFNAGTKKFLFATDLKGASASLVVKTRAELGLAGQRNVAGSGNVPNGNKVTAENLNQLLVAASINARAFTLPATEKLRIETTEASKDASLQISAGDAQAALGLPTDEAKGSQGVVFSYYVKAGTQWQDDANNNLAVGDIDTKYIEQVFFNLQTIDADGNLMSFEDLGFSPVHPRFIGKVLAEEASTKSELLEVPYHFTQDDAALTPFALRDLLFGTATEKSFNLTGGNDGNEPVKSSPLDNNDQEDIESNSYTRALDMLSSLDDIAIVAAPGHSSYEDTNFRDIQSLLITHAENDKYRIAVLDSRQKSSIQQAREARSRIDSKYAALYYPWVTVTNPLWRPGNSQIEREINVPPSGFIAGIYARTDIDRGVWKAPANEVVRGALRFERDINRVQQEVLNPEGINCLRFFFGRGYRVWGARTASSDPEWKYVNVRRYFIYLEHSIDRSTQWAVFEPNGPRLWSNVTETVSAFLYNEWRSGALLGSAEKAYFVRCDRSTMTQSDLDNGRMICEIGVAALKPAEFVIFRIGQKTADA